MKDGRRNLMLRTYLMNICKHGNPPFRREIIHYRFSRRPVNKLHTAHQSNDVPPLLHVCNTEKITATAAKSTLFMP